MQKVIKLILKGINDLKKEQTLRRRHKELNEINPPFTEKITMAPIPRRSKMPQFTSYDGLRNLVNHI